MAIFNATETITLTDVGGTIDLVGLSDISNGFEGSIIKRYYINGSDTLTGSYVVTSTDVVDDKVRFEVIYDAQMTLSGENITIFGVQLTQEQARGKCTIVADYDLNTTTFITQINESADDAMLVLDDVTTTTLDAAGGTITMNPRTGDRILNLTGTATLAASWTVTGSLTDIKHEFWVFYNAALTIGVNSVTIFGIALTADEALNGGVSVYVAYNTTTNAYVAQKVSGSAAQANIPQYLQGYVDELNGNDGTGVFGRLDLPFATISAANTAAEALSPTSTYRPMVNLLGLVTQQLIVKNNIDYNIHGYLRLGTGNSQPTITDNGVDANSNIYGNGIVSRYGTGTTPVGCIFITATNSVVTANFNKIVCSTSGASDVAVAVSAGVLNLNFNSLETTGTGKGLYSSGGTLIFNGQTIETIGSCVSGIGGTQKGVVEYVECTEVASANVDVFSCNTALNQQIECTNIVYANPNSEVVRYNSSGDQRIKVKGTVTCEENFLKTSTGATGICEISGGTWTTSDTLGVQLADSAAEYYLHDMSMKGTGIDCDIISVIGATSVQKIKNLVMETNGAGESITSGVAVNVLNYGGCVTNFAVNGNVTLVVGTVANNQYIVSASVVV